MKRKSVVLSTFAALLVALGPTASAGAAVEQSAGSSNAAGGSASVTLRVEGDSGTIFEGKVTTQGHNVTTVSGGTHTCDGTNGGANPTPGPTATSALDTGSLQAGFTFDGTFDATFDDFFITRVGGDAQTATQFWGILLNDSFIPVGGCQQRVATGDEVLFAFDAFSKAHVLNLAGPKVVRVGQPATYRVTDETGAAVAGAEVNGVTTNAAGDATLTFTAPTVVRVKAERGDSIRSNAVVTKVRP